jgi:Predicted transcriptional regulators containing the CopG/Arc/MetJ DNA-binding domain
MDVGGVMGVPRTEDKMVLVSIRITKQVLDEIYKLVMSGKYPSVSEFIRYAIRDLLNNTRGYLANQVATTTNPQPQAQTQPQEAHQAQQQQHVHTVLDTVVLNTDMKPVTNGPSIEAVEYVIEKLIEWAEVERKSEEVSKRYKECVAKLVDAILNNLNYLRFNIKQEGEVYKVGRKIIREFLEVDCMLPKGMVAVAYVAMTEEFDKRGFIMMRTPTAIILKKNKQ